MLRTGEIFLKSDIFWKQREYMENTQKNSYNKGTTNYQK